MKVSFQLLYQGTLALIDRSDEENMALLSQAYEVNI